MHGGLLGVAFCLSVCLSVRLSVCLGLDQKSLEKNSRTRKNQHLGFMSTNNEMAGGLTSTSNCIFLKPTLALARVLMHPPSYCQCQCPHYVKQFSLQCWPTDAHKETKTDRLDWFSTLWCLCTQEILQDGQRINSTLFVNFFPPCPFMIMASPLVP